MQHDLNLSLGASIRVKHLRSLIIYSFVLLFSVPTIVAQTAPKKYFNKIGANTSSSMAYYYRQATGKDNIYKSYYVNGGALYFEGKITKASNTDEKKNVYSGECKWYHKNGKKMRIRTFSSTGQEQGTSFYYYESGKIWKEIAYKNGQKVGNTYKEYTEDGQASRIYEEFFDNNMNDWDLYDSDKSTAIIEDGKLIMTSHSKEGTSRYVSFPSQSGDYILEGIINIKELKDGEKAGLIIGFKDWQNYNFFAITSGSFYVGSVYEGISALQAEGMYSDAIKDEGNSLKIMSMNGKNIYSINGEIQFKTDKVRNLGSKIGVVISGKSSIEVNKLVFKEIDISSQGVDVAEEDLDVKASGSGLLFSTTGHVITNDHVIEDANGILVEINQNGISKTYRAEVLQRDKINDLAVLKITDDNFKPMSSLQYMFKSSGSIAVGASVFTIGFPMALSGMGKEPKFTDGKISSKTGYNNSLNSFQTSIPVQPGSSGSPLFDEQGQFMGLINAKIMDADNVSYAIKLNYVKNIIEVLTDVPPLPSSSLSSTSSLEEKVKILSKYVVLIKVK